MGPANIGPLLRLMLDFWAHGWAHLIQKRKTTTHETTRTRRRA
jgi:hypothetical protein